MKTKRLDIKISTLVLLLIFTLIGSKALAQDQFVIIANADVPVESIDKSTIKRIYNGFTTQWKNSTKVKPCYMQIQNDAFWKYMGTTKTNFNKFWTKRVFSGNGVSPVEHGSSAALVKYVSEISGAIGILRIEDQKLAEGNCKILQKTN
ncbi:MAG: hypothetical protein ABJF11_04320 [Reichenbachiella sp.]|uniref:hypothetical protein n=1 Tax=Reichenbachiella sp. TaxID=2184521 RepID=UPI003263CC86